MAPPGSGRSRWTGSTAGTGINWGCQTSARPRTGTMGLRAVRRHGKSVEPMRNVDFGMRNELPDPGFPSHSALRNPHLTHEGFMNRTVTVLVVLLGVIVTSSAWSQH